MFVVMVNDVRTGHGMPFACCETRARALEAHAETVSSLLASNAKGMPLVRLADDYATFFSTGTEVAYTVSIATCLKW